MNDELTPDIRPTAATYKTLREIRQRRRQLQREIHAETKQLTRLRKQLFKSESPVRRKGKRFSLVSLMGTGAGVLDGLLLAWKLYRRFKK